MQICVQISVQIIGTQKELLFEDPKTADLHIVAQCKFRTPPPLPAPMGEGWPLLVELVGDPVDEDGLNPWGHTAPEKTSGEILETHSNKFKHRNNLKNSEPWVFAMQQNLKSGPEACDG